MVKSNKNEENKYSLERETLDIDKAKKELIETIEATKDRDYLASALFMKRLFLEV